MEFKEYQKIKRFGSSEVEGLLDGICYIFPKIDGTNASVWLDDNVVKSGSRHRELAFGDKDNAGFNSWVQSQGWIGEFLKDNQDLRIFGEWLVPHTIKDYDESAWRQFYVFDVAVDVGDGVFEYASYDWYAEKLKSAGFRVIDPLFVGIVTPEIIRECLNKNNYLMSNENLVGEGVVIKRYDYKNRYGRTTWAKVIGSEFADKHGQSKATKVSDITVETKLAEDYLTKALCEKTLAKIKLDNGGGFEGKDIPKLLGFVYHDFVTEELWDILKKERSPIINFKKLQSSVYAQTKKLLKDEIF